MTGWEDDPMNRTDPNGTKREGPDEAKNVDAEVSEKVWERLPRWMRQLLTLAHAPPRSEDDPSHSSEQDPRR